MNDKHHNQDACTGHTPDVWTCQNPDCGDTLTADTIGRDSEGEEAKLFCTSCSSRDVRLVEHGHEQEQPAEHINMQQVPIRTDAGDKIKSAFMHPHQQTILDQINSDKPLKPFVLYSAPRQAGKSLLYKRAKQQAEMRNNRNKSQNKD